MVQSVSTRVGSSAISPRLSTSPSPGSEGGDPVAEAVPARLKYAVRLEKLSRIAQEVLARGKPVDVGSLSVDDAQDRLNGLNSIQDWARLSEFRVNATFGGEQTTSVDTYQEWVEARARGATKPEDSQTGISVDSAYLADLERISARFAKIAQAYAQARDPNTADVGSMSPAQAQARLDQLVGMNRVGFLKGMTVSAVFGQDRTESMDVYMSWLEKRANETVSQAPTTGLDVKV
jgi:hypothetical protein